MNENCQTSSRSVQFPAVTDPALPAAAFRSPGTPLHVVDRSLMALPVCTCRGITPMHVYIILCAHAYVRVRVSAYVLVFSCLCTCVFVIYVGCHDGTSSVLA